MYKQIISILFHIHAASYSLHTFLRNNYLLITILLLHICLFILTNPVNAEHKYTIYFYNPETNINNFASLKKEFDLYLSQFGKYQFQPFSKREMFDKLIINKKDGIFILSSWHYKSLKNTAPIEPVMVAISKNKFTCRRIFSTKRKVTDLDSLKGFHVASASSKNYTRDILIQMLGKDREDIVHSMKILTVPKDIDALMSVGFGVADAAITTSNSLIKLASINRKLYDKLKQLLVSDEILLPIVATPKQHNNEHVRLTTLVKEMETAAEGRNKLNMLGFDGWKVLNDSEKKILIR